MRPDHLAQGFFIAPTIFDDVDPGMRIFKEEIFGPVLSVAVASNLEEALTKANGVEYGLTTSIFTQDINAVMRFVEDVEVGMVHVNEPTVGGEAQLPFGGTKSTGVGEREMAEDGLNFFTEIEDRVHQLRGQGRALTDALATTAVGRPPFASTCAPCSATSRAHRLWWSRARPLADGAVVAQQRGTPNPFPGGTNPDGSLRPTAPLTRLFTQDAYTEYAILEPGSESFRIRFLPEETTHRRDRARERHARRQRRLGHRGLRSAHRQAACRSPTRWIRRIPETHAIHAKLPIPVPAGGIGRVLIYKTYKDPRTYMMHGDDIVWVRSLSGYRLGVLLPKGFAFLSSNVAAQLSTTSDGRLKLAFANPSGQSNPVTIHARRTAATLHADARRRTCSSTT